MVGERSEKDEEKSFLDRALKMLAIRDHSRRELGDKLRAKGCGEEVAERILQRLADWGYLDDNRYAAQFVKNKVRNGWGGRRVYGELLRHGVAVEIVEEVCQSLREESGDELSRALELARRKASSGRDYASIGRFLAARGFVPSVAAEAARLALEEFSNPEKCGE